MHWDIVFQTIIGIPMTEDWYMDSPRKPHYLNVGRKLSRAGEDSFDADDYACNLQERRGSSQSMSR